MSARNLLTGAPEVKAPEAWPTPEPLDDLDTPTPPAFGAPKLLPEPLGSWAEDTAVRMNAPVEFTATAALVAAAGVLGNRVLVAPDPEANPGWLEAPNLWALLVGEPGTKKSPVMEAAFAPLHALEGELHRENQRRRTEWELDRRNRKKGDPVSEDDLQPPSEEALLSHDITPEKLADLLEHNPQGLVSFQDELLGLIATWERPEKAGERQFYLKLWNGLSPHTVRRIQRGSHYLPVCTLSLLGGAQPGPLRRYILEAAKGWNNDGLLHRFQLCVYGELPPYQRVVRPPNSLKAEYTARLEGLAGLAARLSGVPQVELRPEVTRPVLTFDPEAQVLYLQWLEQTARESRQPSTPTIKRSLLEKQAGLVPKLALLLHLPLSGMAQSALPTTELRGVWLTNIDSDVLFSSDRLSNGLRRLSRLHFNSIYPTVWNWGYTLYPSATAERVIGRRVDPHSGLQQRDMLAEAVQQGHRLGMAVIPWFEFGFMAPADSELARRHPDWLTQRRDGSQVVMEGIWPRVWMNPFHPRHPHLSASQLAFQRCHLAAFFFQLLGRRPAGLAAGV